MMRKIVTRIFIPVLVIAVAGIGARVIFSLAPEAAESEMSSLAIPVEIVQVQPMTAPSVITSSGIVVPAKELTVTPEVTGRISQRSDELVPGGRLNKGEIVVRIDSRDYLLALKQEEGRVRAAELELQTERGRQGVARREWELLGGDRSPDESSLALRGPHVVARKAELNAAKSGLQRAQLNLSRTTIRAPWNAVVAEAAAEEGQVVSPGTKIARLIGSDELWVRASISLAELSTIDVPGVNSELGSKARVIHELGPGQKVVRTGRVFRLDSQLDSQTRMAQLLIAVTDPLDEPEDAVPLLPGSYVKIELTGRSADGVYVVPREAIHNGDFLWIVGQENRLARRQINVCWGTSDEVFVRGLHPGDRVVTTNMSLPIEGMAVAVQPTRDTPHD